MLSAMKHIPLSAVTAFALLGCMPLTNAGQTTGVDAAGMEFFEAQVRPLLVNRCYECHSAKSDPVEGGYVWTHGSHGSAAVIPEQSSYRENQPKADCSKRSCIRIQRWPCHRTTHSRNVRLRCCGNGSNWARQIHERRKLNPGYGRSTWRPGGSSGPFSRFAIRRHRL